MHTGSLILSTVAEQNGQILLTGKAIQAIDTRSALLLFLV